MFRRERSKILRYRIAEKQMDQSVSCNAGNAIGSSQALCLGAADGCERDVTELTRPISLAKAGS
jgi:hypothetical protein